MSKGTTARARPPGGEVEVSMIGTLPPLKGISPYCAELLKFLSGYTNVEFLDFNRLYLERLYPGGTREEDLYPIDLEEIDFIHRRAINALNPLSWIRAGLSLRGDIVHAQWWTAVLAPVFFTILMISRLRGKKTIITVHNVEPHEESLVSQLLNRIIVRMGDELIVHSNSNREKMFSQIGGPRKPVHVIPHIPFSSAQNGTPESYRTSVRHELGLGENSELILFFGNIREYKGLDILLNAVPEVLRERPDAMFLVAGQPWEDWDKYDHIIKTRGIENNVKTDLRYLPFNELHGYIVGSDLVVFPFKKLDSASGTVIMARSLGKPVVASDLGCIADLEDEGVYLVKPGCHESLGQRINEALTRYAARSPAYAEGAFGLSEESCEAVAIEHILVYRNEPAYLGHAKTPQTRE